MNVDNVIDYYMSLKRIFYNKPIPRPKPETNDYDDLIRLAILLNEQNIPYEEYILVNLQAYRRKKIFPRPNQLLGVKALNRYNEYARKRYTVGRLFRADPHSVCVYATNTYYPIEEFNKPFDKDLKALVVFSFVKEDKYQFDKQKLDKVWETAEYTLAKYEWLGLIVPDSLLAWKEKLNNERRETQ